MFYFDHKVKPTKSVSFYEFTYHNKKTSSCVDKHNTNSTNSVNSISTADNIIDSQTNNVDNNCSNDCSNNKNNSEQCEQLVTNRINKIKKMCDDYSKKCFLTNVDVVKLAIEILELHKFDPVNSSKYLDFIKVVYDCHDGSNSSKSDSMINPIFFNPSSDFDKLKFMAQCLLEQKQSKIAICYWNGVHYKDGISFQIYGSHNVPTINFGNYVDSSGCYDERIKEFTSQGKLNRVIIYELLQ